MRQRTLLQALLVLAAAGAAWLWLSPGVPRVTVAELARGTAADIVYATGVVEPASWAKVTPVIRGRIVESCNCEGHAVAEGAMLFRLDATETRARMDELRALLDLAEKELDRSADLYDRGIATRERYDRDLADVARLRAGLAAAESALIDLELRAPLAGQVLRLDGEVGEVADLGDALAWVGQPKPLLVIAEVNEEDIPDVVVGQRALLRADAFPDRALEAEVASITPMGNPELKTYRVRLALPEDTPVLIGMSVDVNIVVRTVEDAVLAPTAALLGDRLQVVDRAGRVSLRPVETGIRGAERTEIAAGAEAGERVVSPARDGLSDGAVVRVEAP